LGIYDVDHCKFMMQRSPHCFINSTDTCGHEYYYKSVLKIKDKLKKVDKICLIDVKNAAKSLEHPIVHLLKRDYRSIKNNDTWKELKKKEEFSVKTLKNYDSNFWNKFLGGIKGMKDHIRKLRVVTNNLDFGEIGKLTQILKSNII